MSTPSPSEANMNQKMYCAVADVVERTLIKSNDVTHYTTSVTNAIVEASRMVDVFLKPYVEEVPLTEVPDAVVIITADFATSIFKRRLTPAEVKIRGSLQPDMINDVDGTGWFALGLKKLLDFIKSEYALDTATDANDILNNPEVFTDLFKKGILTLKEARAYIGNATATINKIISETQTITRTITETTYPTKKQKSFSFISGKEDNSGGYNKYA